MNLKSSLLSLLYGLLCISVLGLMGCASSQKAHITISDSAWVAVNAKVDSLLTEDEYVLLLSRHDSNEKQGNPLYLLVGGIVIGAMVSGILFRAH
jgi:hypothetical protein